ncbi:TetR/AcrR family transcriptional regulator [Streptomyces sp. PU-14G]|uniref:TetR/AcrR family transcriptional regulator n=1 Tax=Streptomyces sp. PU-14G TaxID=2800808 RepID=UPI0034DFA891
MNPPEPSPGPAPGRPARADARRNREKLLTAARTLFATAEGAVPLDAVAREAGVGIGTLYRHFPTREALVEAVYAAELDEVVAAAPALLADLPPDAALRGWLDCYAGFVAAKRGLLETLRAGWASGSIATPDTRGRLTAAIATVLEAGTREGSLRGDVDPGDVLTLLLGLFHANTAGGAPHRVGPLLDLIVDALRPRTGD